MERKFYRPEEVAQALGVSLFTVMRWLRTGRVPSVKLNGRWRVPAEWLAHTVASAARKAPEEGREA